MLLPVVRKNAVAPTETPHVIGAARPVRIIAVAGWRLKRAVKARMAPVTAVDDLIVTPATIFVAGFIKSGNWV
jgi:hypothetical protein